MADISHLLPGLVRTAVLDLDNYVMPFEEYPISLGSQGVSTKTMERFLSHVDTSGDCWLWNGLIRPETGYGRFCVDNGEEHHASRVSWMFFKGPIDDGLFVCHICDNPRCVRPSHLFLGTPIQNTWDMLRKDRQNRRKGSQHKDAKLTEEQVKNIRTVYTTGEVSLRKLGKMFGISETTVHSIVKRHTWKHV